MSKHEETIELVRETVGTLLPWQEDRIREILMAKFPPKFTYACRHKETGTVGAYLFSDLKKLKSYHLHFMVPANWQPVRRNEDGSWSSLLTEEEAEYNRA